uniref:Uncharacterized protein n=1 Tax=Aegilops tauschii subsp. strangulata TaxID=200361 RepID=A0A453R8G4_AEGTS
ADRHAAEEVRAPPRRDGCDHRRRPAEAEEAEGATVQAPGHVQRRLKGGSSASGGCHHRPTEQGQRQEGPGQRGARGCGVGGSSGALGRTSRGGSRGDVESTRRPRPIRALKPAKRRFSGRLLFVTATLGLHAVAGLRRRGRARRVQPQHHLPPWSPGPAHALARLRRRAVPSIHLLTAGLRVLPDAPSPPWRAALLISFHVASHRHRRDRSRHGRHHHGRLGRRRRVPRVHYPGRHDGPQRRHGRRARVRRGGGGGTGAGSGEETQEEEGGGQDRRATQSGRPRSRSVSPKRGKSSGSTRSPARTRASRRIGSASRPSSTSALVDPYFKGAYMQRGSKAMANHWGLIQLACNKWHEIVEEIAARPESGTSIE